MFILSYIYADMHHICYSKSKKVIRRRALSLLRDNIGFNLTIKYDDDFVLPRHDCIRGFNFYHNLDFRKEN